MVKLEPRMAVNARIQSLQTPHGSDRKFPPNCIYKGPLRRQLGLMTLFIWGKEAR